MHEREIIECHSQTEMCVFFLRLRTSLQFLTVQCYLGTPVLYSICVSLLYMSATPVYISHTMTTRCNFLDFFMIYIIYMQCQICRETRKRQSGCWCTLGWMSYGMAGEVSKDIYVCNLHFSGKPRAVAQTKIKLIKMRHRLICSKKRLTNAKDVYWRRS